jgi:hypothetical protein
MRNFFKIQISDMSTLCVFFPKSKIQTPILFTLCFIFPNPKIHIQDLFSLCVIIPISKFQICWRCVSFFQSPNSNSIYVSHHIWKIQIPNSNPVYIMHYISKTVNHIMLLIWKIKIVLHLLTPTLKFPKLFLTVGIYNILTVQCSPVHRTLFLLDLCYSGIKCSQPSSLSWNIRWILRPTSAVTGQRWRLPCGAQPELLTRGSVLLFRSFHSSSRICTSWMKVARISKYSDVIRWNM